MGSFILDTKNMSAVADMCKALYEKMQSLERELKSSRDVLMEEWAGKGAKEFSRQFELLSRQFGDIKEGLRETRESIVNSEDAYIEADNKGANA